MRSYAIHQVARICPSPETECHYLLSFESAVSNCTVLEHSRCKHRTRVFKLLDKCHPERKQAKKARLSAVVRVLALSSRILTHRDMKKTIFAKYGLKFVTAPIEAKKAALVIIAHDVDPIELVIFLPAFAAR